MRRRLSLLLLVLLSAAPVALAAQGVVMPEKPLDPPHAAVRDGYLVLRDSLAGVTASIARLQRDLAQSSAYVLASRSGVLQERCSAALRTLPGTRKAFLDSPLMVKVPSVDRTALREKFESLASSLNNCQRRFTAWSNRSKSAELRGYGVPTALETGRAIHRYEAAANDVLRAIGIRLRPLGAGHNPLAGKLDSPDQPTVDRDSGTP